jgi:multiple sugar transport system permease protein
MTAKTSWRTRAYYGVLWFVAFLFFLPVLWIILSSFKDLNGILARPPLFIFTPSLDNYRELFSIPEMVRDLRNSVIISLAALLIALVVAYLAAYSFSRFKPAGTDLFMFLLLSIRMVPAAAVVVPVFLMYTAFGWKGTWGGVILYYAMFSIPFSVWILKGFIDGVSPRFDETALVNGGSRWHVITHVILPQVRPGLIAAFIFNLIFVWNEFLFNFIVSSANTETIPVLLATNLYSDGGLNWTFMTALTTLYMIPPIVFIFFFQRYLLVGMTFGTVRGEV